MLRTRSHWLVAGLIASSALTATVAQAQQTPTPTQTQAPTQAQKPRGDRMLHRLQKNLGLTDDQVNQIRVIFQGQRDAHKQMWQTMRQAQIDLRQAALNGGDANTLAAKKATVAQLQAQGLELRVQTLQQIGPVLTQEQRDKFAQMGPAAMYRGHHRGHKPPKAQG